MNYTKEVTLVVLVTAVIPCYNTYQCNYLTLMLGVPHPGTHWVSITNTETMYTHLCSTSIRNQ